MPEAMVNGVRIWYQETGAGDSVVRIHGAGLGHFNFATATPILSKSFRCIDFAICAATASLNDLSNAMTWKFGRTKPEEPKAPEHPCPCWGGRMGILRPSYEDNSQRSDQHGGCRRCLDISLPQMLSA
jgi:hypothetical protein